MTTDGAGDVDLDLYADVEGGEFSHEGGYEDKSPENATDLFDDVIVPSANNDFPDLNGHPSSNNGGVNKQPLLDHQSSMPPQNYPGKRVSCYVGNLTWWTTDQDLTDSINSIGIPDLIEIKFYENKINGQSKGYLFSFLISSNLFINFLSFANLDSQLLLSAPSPPFAF